MDHSDMSHLFSCSNPNCVLPHPVPCNFTCCPVYLADGAIKGKKNHGDIKLLVDQTLDPMVSAYFKNNGQTKTLIQLIQERYDIQAIASSEMQAKFTHYNLEEVLIGTPTASESDDKIEVILTQLRERQIAVEQVETYGRQQRAAEQEKILKEAEARAARPTPSNSC